MKFIGILKFMYLCKVRVMSVKVPTSSSYNTFTLLVVIYQKPMNPKDHVFFKRPCIFDVYVTKFFFFLKSHQSTNAVSSI